MKLNNLSESDAERANLTLRVIYMWLLENGWYANAINMHDWENVILFDNISIEIDYDGDVQAITNEEPHHSIYIDLHDPQCFGKLAEFLNEYEPKK